MAPRRNPEPFCTVSEACMQRRLRVCFFGLYAPALDMHGSASKNKKVINSIFRCSCEVAAVGPDHVVLRHVSMVPFGRHQFNYSICSSQRLPKAPDPPATTFLLAIATLPEYHLVGNVALGCGEIPSGVRWLEYSSSSDGECSRFHITDVRMLEVHTHCLDFI